MLRPEKVATPFTAAVLAGPSSVTLEGFVAIARVTESLKADVRLPSESCASTTMGEGNAAPANAAAGAPVTTSWCGAAGAIENDALVAGVSPLAVATSVY